MSLAIEESWIIKNGKLAFVFCDILDDSDDHFKCVNFRIPGQDL